MTLMGSMQIVCRTASCRECEVLLLEHERDSRCESFCIGLRKRF